MGRHHCDSDSSSSSNKKHRSHIHKKKKCKPSSNKLVTTAIGSDYKLYTYNLKRDEFENLKKKYVDNGEIDWATFYIDQNANKNKVVLLKNSDFVNGTLRIKAPCMLKLTEHLIFNPNRPTTWLDSNDNITNDVSKAVKLDPNRQLDWYPNVNASNNSQYFEPEVVFAYGLGFFAAIAIECENVVVDLNNFTMAQHPEHALQQRFYSHIELADQPFLPLQGPSNFGNILRSAVNTFICNGKLGLSSHHGIHGNNGGNDIMIENVMFEDFEVAALALNGFKNIYLKNLTGYKNRQNIPVLSTYSASRFIKLFVQMTEQMGYGNPNLTSAKNALYNDTDAVFNSVILKNTQVQVPSLFKNTSGLIDAIAYGLVINPNGVAVNQFLENRSSFRANETTNIYMFNCNMANIKSRADEIVAISNLAGNSAQVDTAGAALQFFRDVSVLNGNKYYYSGTSLSNVQIELAKIKFSLDSSNISSKFFGTLNIDKGIQDWKDNSALYFKIENNQLILYDGTDNKYMVGSNPVIYKIFCNGDSMFHVVKGTIGIRIDGANNLCMLDCGVSNVLNTGLLGSELAGPYVQSHPSQGSKLIGYQGTKCYGITFAAVNNLYIENLQIFNIESINGSAHGVAIMNESQNCSFNNLCVNNIFSNRANVFSPINLPNEVPISRSILVTNDCLNIKFKNVNSNNIINSSGSPYHYDYDIRTKVLME